MLRIREEFDKQHRLRSSVETNLFDSKKAKLDIEVSRYPVVGLDTKG